MLEYESTCKLEIKTIAYHEFAREAIGKLSLVGFLSARAQISGEPNKFTKLESLGKICSGWVFASHGTCFKGFSQIFIAILLLRRNYEPLQ